MTSHEDMAKWTFQQIIEGLCQGKPLHRIATNIVDGVANMVAQNLKEKP